MQTAELQTAVLVIYILSLMFEVILPSSTWAQGLPAPRSNGLEQGVASVHVELMHVPPRPLLRPTF
jgi:hypothetical protein